MRKICIATGTRADWGLRFLFIFPEFAVNIVKLIKNRGGELLLYKKELILQKI